jgi:hypothetical protein
MADNSKIYTAVPGTATTETVSITFPFLKKSHIEVRVSNAGETLSAFKTRLAAGSVTAETFNTDYSITGTTVTFVTATLDNGSTYQVETKRNSDILTSYVDFVDGSIVTEANLDDAHTQQLYVSQELQDNKATLKEDGSVAANITGDVTGNVTGNLTGNVTGNVTGNLTGDVTGNADTVTTNANLTGGVTSVGNAATVVTNANLTGGVTSSGNAATVVTNANLTGDVTSVGNAATVVTNANLTGDVTSVGNATTTITNANLTGDVTSVGNATTLGTVPIAKGGSGATAAQAAIDALTQSSGATTDHVLTKNSSGNAVWVAAVGASGGEANTASNVGTGEGTIFKQKSSVDLEFKKIAQGSNITVTDSGTEITIAATSGGGDTLPILDSTAVVKDPVDATKLARIDAGAITTGTTRVITMGDRDVDLASAGTFAESAHNHDSSYSATGHNHSGVYEPADATIVKDSDIGVNVQAFDATIMVDADIGGTVMAHATGNAVLGTTQTWTKAQVPATQTASFSTTPDFDAYQNFIYTLASGANTFATATTEAGNVGQTGLFVFIQPSSGSAGTVVLHADYESVGGSGLTVSATNSAYDIVPYIIKADASILMGAPQLAFS